MRAGSPLPSGPLDLPTSTPVPSLPALPLVGGKHPPGVWPRGPVLVAGDERGMVLGALEAVQLGGPEGWLGWAGSCHIQPLLYLDSGEGDTGPVCQGAAEAWTGSEREDKGLQCESPPHHPLTQKDLISLQVLPHSSPPFKDHL